MSGLSSAAATNTAAVANGASSAGSLETPLPSAQTLLQAARQAQAMDRPILLDYYADSFFGKAVIGEDPETKDKLLVKSPEEFTSLIQKIFKVGDDYLVHTENSIYIISARIGKKRLATAQLLASSE
jgi:hypothetical protein